MTIQNLDGKVALVTGGGSGIGQAICLELASRGAIVIVADIKEDAAKRVCSTIHAQEGRSLAYALDVSDDKAWEDLSAMLAEDYGSLDILVNNAGIMLVSSVAETTLKQWNAVMSINLDSVFFGMKMTYPLMEKAGGVVVNMASTAALRGTALASAYSASKAGVVSMTKSTARQYAQEGVDIRVNAICPGPIDTPIYSNMTGAARKALGSDEAVREKILESIPLGRFGTAEEITSAVMYLVSDQARFITGAVLSVDGGQSS